MKSIWWITGVITAKAKVKYGTEGNKKISPVDFDVMEISKTQCDSVIEALSACRMAWAWAHATAEVKSALKGTVSDEDLAREIYRDAINRYPDKCTYEKVKSEILRAVKMSPKLNSIRCELGKISIENGEVNEAINLFEDEISCSNDPKLLTAHKLLGCCLSGRGQIE